MTVLQEVKVVRPQCADICCSDTCQMLVNWEVVKSREVFPQKKFSSDLLLSVSMRKVFLQRFNSVVFPC